MKALILLLLLLNISIAEANVCASLFLENRPSETEINVAIQELHILKVRSYSQNRLEASIAQSLYKQKSKDLEAYIPKTEIRDRLRSIKLEVSSEEIFPVVANGASLAKEIVMQAKLKEYLDSIGSKSIEGKGAVQNMTPLTIASMDGKEDIVEMLLSEGADVNARNDENKTPLILALQNIRLKIAKSLISAGADVNARDDYGNMPLFLIYGDVELIELLLSKGADVNAKDKKNNEALFLYARYGFVEATELLISKGANVNNRNNVNKTALTAAKEYNHPKIIKILEDNGAVEWST